MINVSQTSGDTAIYNKTYDYACQVLITARVDDGWDFITLDYLKSTLGADTPSKANGVRWGVNAAKVAGLIAATDTKAVYKVTA